MIKHPPLKDIVAVLIIIAVIGGFFFKLFYPIQQLIVTPDFIRSDAWHSSISTKYLLSKALQTNTIPLWTSTLNSGFPLIGEGQIGAFFLPNILLYKLFPPFIAYNFSLIFAVATVGIGTFFWFRKIGITRSVALFGGITASLSGPVISHLTHIALLQSFSLLPWVMLMTYQLALFPSLRTIALFACIVACQFFAGSPQPVLITCIFSFSYFIYLIYKQDKRLIKIFLYIITYVLALALSAIQLLPSQEFLKQTTNPTGFSLASATLYQFPLLHILTYLNPFALGNPKLGTYYQQSNASGSIFWENSGYIGLLPLSFICTYLFIKRKTIFKNISTYFWGISAFITFMLMLGMSSPLYIVYSFWPLTLFHVSSRFIWILNFILIMICVKSFDTILSRIRHSPFFKIFIITCLILQSFDLISNWSNYHMYMPIQSWTEKPPISKYIHPQDVIYSIGIEQIYNNAFIKGWKNTQPYYFLQNSLMPNGSAVWGYTNFNVVTGRELWRNTLAKTELSQEITATEHTATISATGNNLLDLFHITTVLSSTPIDDQSLTPITQLRYNKDLSLYLYTNPNTVHRAYLATSVETATTVEQAQRILNTNTFIPGKTVLLEKNFGEQPSSDTQGTVTIDSETGTKIQIQVNNNNENTYLVLTSMYYPGWQATIDGKNTKIFPANISQQAIAMPKGNHTVIFEYQPASFKKGLVISCISLFIVTCLMAFPLSLLLPGTYRKIFLPFSHRGNNHDT